MITSYDTMPIGIYEKIREAVSAADAEDNEVNARIVAILADMREDDVFTLPLMKYREMAEKAAFLLEQPEGAKVRREYTVKGEERVWRLRLTRDYRNITYGQFMDAREYGREADTHLAELMSVALVPYGEKYGEGYDIWELQRDLRAAFPITDALAVTAFFLRRSIRSYNRFLRSLAWKMARVTMSRRNTKEAREKAAQIWAVLERSGMPYLYSTLSLTLPAAIGIRQARCLLAQLSQYTATDLTGMQR